MKPFDLEKAKAGAKVCTRDGRSARIICFDRKQQTYPIVALIQHEFKKYEEDLTTHCKDGKRCPTLEQREDLFMAPEKKEGWLNVFRDGDTIFTDTYIYPTKEDAKRGKRTEEPPYIGTFKIEWEE